MARDRLVAPRRRGLHERVVDPDVSRVRLALARSQKQHPEPVTSRQTLRHQHRTARHHRGADGEDFGQGVEGVGVGVGAGFARVEGVEGGQERGGHADVADPRLAGAEARRGLHGSVVVAAGPDHPGRNEAGVGRGGLVGDAGLVVPGLVVEVGVVVGDLAGAEPVDGHARARGRGVVAGIHISGARHRPEPAAVARDRLVAPRRRGLHERVVDPDVSRVRLALARSQKQHPEPVTSRQTLRHQHRTLRHHRRGINLRAQGLDFLWDENHAAQDQGCQGNAEDAHEQGGTRRSRAGRAPVRAGRRARPDTHACRL